MSLDSFLDEMESEMNAENKVVTNGEYIQETVAAGNKLIDVDYLPQISKIKELERHLIGIKSMNLFNRGWRFNLGSSREWAGLCNSQDDFGSSAKGKNVYVSIQFVKHDKNWQQNMNGVILHELAHAIVREVFEGRFDVLNQIDPDHRPTQGHGRLFKIVCAAISGNECPTFYSDGNFKDSFKPYKYTCFNCMNVEYGRWDRFTSHCSECGNIVTTEKNN